MDKIGIITYNFTHLKTEQVVTKLIELGYDLVIFALPFYPRNSQPAVFNHRPNQLDGMHTRELAIKYSIPYYLCESDKDIKSDCNLYILTGAGILSRECVIGKKILNCHPGIIPIERGLDAFKWGIYDLNPIGNTLYIISPDVDLGEIIKIKKTPLLSEDTIQDFANRHYSEEIDMLVHFQKYIDETDVKEKNVFISSSMEVVHKRMPKHIEQQMLQRFATYKEKYAEKRRKDSEF